MSKELKALENIKLCFKRIEEVSKDAREVLGMELIGKIDWDNIEEISIIEKALLELKAIKEANPSKAMNELNEIIEYINEDKKVKYKATILFDCEIIKDALLKAEENAKLLGYLKNNLSLIPMETGEDEIGIGCPINGDTIGPNDEGYEAIKKWLSNEVNDNE